jgi:hypothetical protein
VGPFAFIKIVFPDVVTETVEEVMEGSSSASTKGDATIDMVVPSVLAEKNSV